MSLSRYRELIDRYDRFVYESYHIEEIDDQLMLNFQYRILGDDEAPIVFNHRISYALISDNHKLDLGRIKEFDALIFSIGLVEGINYYKTVCPKEFFVRPGRLTKDQKCWWQKLYYHGLGEFIYLNGLADEVTQENFVRFTDDESIPNDFELSDLTVEGNLIPIGGGKDSVVTLELLESRHKENLPFVMSPPQAAYDCIQVAGYSEYLLAKRYFDKRMLAMNGEGYLNGHVPFSAILGFVALFGAALTGKRYIPLSNERSANESTIIGESYNHQYSKSYEFEKDFNDYTSAYLVKDIRYFSLLRPLYEVEIAERFAAHTKYHEVFRSCNRGKKDNSWCGVCSKCLFVNIILAPYMPESDLEAIFGSNLLDNGELQPILSELLGMTDKKPFECVGTIDEVHWSLNRTCQKYLSEGRSMPVLLQYYRHNFSESEVKELDMSPAPNCIPEVYKGLLEA